jgi:hypothetical protein
MMTRSVSKILSYVLHPLLMPFYAVMLVLNLNTYLSFSISLYVQKLVMTVVFITTVALPVVTSIFLMQQGFVKSLEMESPQERRLPFMAAGIYFLVCYYLLLMMPVPRVLPNMVLGAALSIFIAWAINFKWKISIHMVGVGGVVGLLIGISIRLGAGLWYPIMASVLIAGLLGSARLRLGAHNEYQIYAGFFLGMFLEWFFTTL